MFLCSFSVILLLFSIIILFAFTGRTTTNQPYSSYYISRQ